MIRFKAEERKADVVAPLLDAAAAAGGAAVAAIGCAQEFQLVWTARKHDTGPGRSPQFSFTKEQRRVSVFYIYIWDTRMGPGFIKICTYFPYPAQSVGERAVCRAAGYAASRRRGPGWRADRAWLCGIVLWPVRGYRSARKARSSSGAW